MERVLFVLVGAIALAVSAPSAQAQSFTLSFSSNPAEARVCNKMLKKCFKGRIDANGNRKDSFTLVSRSDGDKVTVKRTGQKYKIVHKDRAGKVLMSDTIEL